MRRAALGVILACLTAEGLARRLEFVPQSYVPEFGWVYQPGRAVHRCREGFGRSRWAYPGIRRAGPVIPGDPPIILAVGDSFTEALQVDDDVVYTAQLELGLKADGVARTVVNLGHASRSPADYVALAPLYRKTFEPRWTTIEVSRSDLVEDAWQPDKTHFEHAADGSPVSVVVKDDPPPSRRLAGKVYHQLLNRSAMFQMGAGQVAGFLMSSGDEPPLFRAGDVRRSNETGTSEEDSSPRVPVEEELELLVRAYNHQLTVLYVADLIPEAPERETSFERRIEAACASRRVSFVSTRSGYRDIIAAGLSPFGFANTGFNKGHLNATGHTLVARLLRAELVRLAKDGLL